MWPTGTGVTTARLAIWSQMGTLPLAFTFRNELAELAHGIAISLEGSSLELSLRSSRRPPSLSG